jgi:hypothetical protein
VEFVLKCRNVLFVRCLLLRYLCVVASVFTCLGAFVIAGDIFVRGANILVSFCVVFLWSCLRCIFFFFPSSRLFGACRLFMLSFLVFWDDFVQNWVAVDEVL